MEWGKMGWGGVRWDGMGWDRGGCTPLIRRSLRCSCRCANGRTLSSLPSGGSPRRKRDNVRSPAVTRQGKRCSRGGHVSCRPVLAPHRCPSAVHVTHTVAMVCVNACMPRRGSSQVPVCSMSTIFVAFDLPRNGSASSRWMVPSRPRDAKEERRHHSSPLTTARARAYCVGGRAEVKRRLHVEVTHRARALEASTRCTTTQSGHTAATNRSQRVHPEPGTRPHGGHTAATKRSRSLPRSLACSASELVERHSTSA